MSSNRKHRRRTRAEMSDTPLLYGIWLPAEGRWHGDTESQGILVYGQETSPLGQALAESLGAEWKPYLMLSDVMVQLAGAIKSAVGIAPAGLKKFARKDGEG